jgi:hypothetical protein
VEAGETTRQDAPDQAVAEFISAFAASLTDGSFVRITLGCWRGIGSDLQRATVRLVAIKGTSRLNVTAHHKTRDITSNHAVEAGPEVLRNWLLQGFRAARLFTTTGDLQIDWNKSTGFHLARSAPTGKPTGQSGHDRVKRRLVPVSAPFLEKLGVTDDNGRVLPSMSHKWKQINKFVEILDHAVADSTLASQPSITVADFGAGKGYLTFAAHHHLQNTIQKEVDVSGIERRDDLVDFCNKVVSTLGLSGIAFHAGDLQTHSIKALDVLIALHACDTATDEAIALGIRSGAAVIVCAPCCHKEVRPQLIPPDVLRPLLHFGIHAAREAEMLTDTIRALLMETHGYRTQVFEFVSSEHTDKNKMILGILRPEKQNTERTDAELAAIKAFYGIKEHRLEELLRQCSTGTCAPSG